MLIESITPPISPKKYWMLHLEDGSHLRAYGDAMADFALHSGMDLSDEQLNDLRRAASLTQLRGRAVNVLSYRPHSRQEAQKKLLEKGGDPDQIEDVLHWAEDIGLLNDEDYAKTLVQHYSNKGYGLYKIRDELYRRGVARELWEVALAELSDTDATIDAYISRHLRSGTPKDRKRVSDALARRGFSWSDISAALGRHVFDEEENDEV